MAPDLVDYDTGYLEPLVRLWRESFEFGVGVTDPNPLSRQRDDFVAAILPSNRVTLALLSSRLVGFMSASAESVAQLHVQVGLHRQGIGSALLALAKAAPPVACGCTPSRATCALAVSTKSMASSWSRAASSREGCWRTSNTGGRPETIEPPRRADIRRALPGV